MAWIALAKLAATAYGAISAKKGAKDSAKGAQSAENRAIDLEEQQYEDWKAIFGDIGKNVGDYYENLSPAGMTAQGLEAYEIEKTNAVNALRQNLDQRGLGTSGLSKGFETQVALASAGDRAKIRAEAPMKVAQAQSDFLAMGLNNNPMNQTVQNAQGRLTQAARAAAEARGASQEATGAALGAGADFLEDIFGDV